MTWKELSQYKLTQGAKAAADLLLLVGADDIMINVCLILNKRHQSLE